jgi:hypothetical protein
MSQSPLTGLIDNEVGSAGSDADQSDLQNALGRLERHISAVPVSMIRVGESPRLEGLDADHVRALAEIDEELPPILVHRATMRVIDGMHRLDAARMCRRPSIDVRFFDGSPDDAFLLAVEANIAHGLPLTLADRRAAAERILRNRPRMSDRSIAGIVGLAAKTVGSIRRQAFGASRQGDLRIGRDGRVRPVSSLEGRRVAAQIVAEDPEASLRKVAKASGISIGTARDVRDRVRRGEDPVPTGRLRKHEGDCPTIAGRSAPRVGPDSGILLDTRLALERLRHDPALRYNESGRGLLRWLSPLVICDSDWLPVVDNVPPHAAIVMARIARACSATWANFADELDRRHESCA